MTIVDGKCKFCGRGLRLEIDEEYSVLGDPYGLIPMAACNSCADYRTSARQILERLRRRCIWLEQGIINTKELREKVETRMKSLIGQYMALLASHWSVPLPDLDERIIVDLMEHPAQFSKIIRQIPRLYQQKTML